MSEDTFDNYYSAVLLDIVYGEILFPKHVEVDANLEADNEALEFELDANLKAGISCFLDLC